MKTRHVKSASNTTNTTEEQRALASLATRSVTRRIPFAYARSRGRHAAIHDSAPRAAVHSRIGIVSHPYHHVPSQWASIRSRMENVLAEHGGRGGEAVTLLAAATDRLFASIAKQRGMRLSVVIPCKNFQNFFATPDDLSEYLYLRTSATARTVLDHPTFNVEAFESAARFIVDICDLLVVVGSGNKTACHAAMGNIVKYASDRDKLLVWIDPDAPVLSRRLSPIR